MKELDPSNKESFLDLYMSYTSKQESPALFHLWTGFAILSASLGRKCWLNRGYYKLYPNLFTILVAGSAECRKSTAIEIGTSLLDSIESVSSVNGKPAAIKIFDGKITPEKFIREISSSTIQTGSDFISPSCLVWADELSVFLSKQAHSEPMIHILTRLFACPSKWSYKTKNQGEDFLHNVFISIIAATTPTGIARGIPESAMDEGFASRVIFVYQDYDPTREALFPEITAQDLEMHEALRTRLERISKIEGEFTLTEEAKVWAKDWYHKHRQEPPEDERLGGMHARKHDHMFRLGMILAGSEESKLVDINHLDAAIVALNGIEQLTSKAFTHMGGDLYSTHINRARGIMRRWKILPYSEFMRRMTPAGAHIVKVVIDTLMQGKEIEWDKDDPKALRITSNLR